MKLIISNPSLAPAAQASIPAGRHVSTISQVVNLGLMPGFGDEPPRPEIGVAFHTAGGVIARAMTVRTGPSSMLGQLLAATGLLTGTEVDLQDLLGREVAIEVDINAKGYARVIAVSELETWEEPIRTPYEHVYLDFTVPPDATFNVRFQALHRDLRMAAARRIRAGGKS